MYFCLLVNYIFILNKTYIIAGFIRTYNTYFILYGVVYTVLYVTTLVYSTCMSE